MTATIDQVIPANRTTAHRTTAASETDLLLDVLQATIADLAFTEPDELGSQRPAGRELLGLAAMARSAITGLGGHAGATVTEAPGVVVVRELVAATRALSAAVALTSRA